ncbi:HesA/MoeB/ThiF family protein [Microbacterium phyllosphaerae]|uniref:HesA/MoeB/ThiF family protein n=1 Tax=Microbacterium phyllosphaerae TaxID=124798 RepID=UPI00216A446F|nr:ThiF family adenylyltransferase [Microbacterium phyllosphaerae]MCS3443226.1 molybdopterin/thiamine biosynthesis adenylyltransferase [Microbacterium phyllosphaerae]
MKPRIRSGHAVVHLERGESVIGSMTYGLGQVMRDRDGLLLALNQIVDGDRTLDASAEELCSALDVSLEAAHAFLRKLIGSGHIEDASAVTDLATEDQDRYSRSAHYFSWIARTAEPSRWKPQELLKAARVTVIGVGGIGGAIATHLVSAGVGAIHLVDGDRVELSNLNRQYLYCEADLGRYKVEAAADRLRSMNSACQITTSSQEVTGPRRARELLAHCELLFRAADRPDEMPYWVSDEALKLGTPWIDCSYAGPMINCCIYVPGTTGCYRCLRDSARQRLEHEGRFGSFSESPPPFNAAFGPVVQMAGSLAAYEGVRFITGLSPQTVGRAFHQNMFDYSHSYVVEVPDECSHE